MALVSTNNQEAGATAADKMADDGRAGRGSSIHSGSYFRICKAERGGNGESVSDAVSEYPGRRGLLHG